MPGLVQFVLAAVVVTAGVSDLRSRRIPNWLVLFGLAAGISLNAVFFGWQGLGTSLLGAGLAFLVNLPLYLIRGLGGGDLKLNMAVGAFLGPKNWLTVFVLGAVLGGVLALAMIFSRGRLAKTVSNIRDILISLAQARGPWVRSEELDVKSDRSLRLPRGVVIALATLIFLVASR